MHRSFYFVILDFSQCCLGLTDRICHLIILVLQYALTDLVENIELKTVMGKLDFSSLSIFVGISVLDALVAGVLFCMERHSLQSRYIGEEKNW